MVDREQSLIRGKHNTLQKTEGPRILVVGTRLSGAVNLQADFEKYIEELGLTNPPKVEWLRDINRLSIALTGYPDKQGRIVPKTAQGVILMPEVRVYIGDNPGSYDTYGSEIDTFVENLCKKSRVPLVMIRHGYSRDQINEQIGSLFGKRPALQLGLSSDGS